MIVRIKDIKRFLKEAEKIIRKNDQLEIAVFEARYRHPPIIARDALKTVLQIMESTPEAVSIRDAVLKVLQNKNKAETMHLDELVATVQSLGIASDRMSIRIQTARMVGKDLERTAYSTYKLK